MSRGKLAVTTVLAVALCMAMVIGAAACGKEVTVASSDEVGNTLASNITTTSEEQSTSDEAVVDPALVGKWAETGGDYPSGSVVEFTADGRMLEDEPGTGVREITYETEGGMIALGGMGTALPPAHYSIDGDTLTIEYSDGVTEVYTRVK
jgi:hypothetical protein